MSVPDLLFKPFQSKDKLPYCLPYIYFKFESLVIKHKAQKAHYKRDFAPTIHTT